MELLDEEDDIEPMETPAFRLGCGETSAVWLVWFFVGEQNCLGCEVLNSEKLIKDKGL